MKEEKVTINIIKWLQENDWEIICYDFPQSGTGRILHPNHDSNSEKNKGGIIPDIIAIKVNKAIFFENKDRFVLSDFEKIHFIKTTNHYSESLNKLIGHIPVFFGIGMPKTDNNILKSTHHQNMVDFIITTDVMGLVYIEYDRVNVFTV